MSGTEAKHKRNTPLSVRCTVCTHERRGEMEQAILAGSPIRQVASQYGVTAASLHRHITRHMAQAYVAAQEHLRQQRAAQAVEEGLDLMAQVAELNALTRAILEEARSAKRYAAAVQAIQAAIRLLEVQARLTGALDESPKVQVQVGVVLPRPALDALYQAIEAAPLEVRRRIALALAEVTGEGEKEPPYP